MIISHHLFIFIMRSVIGPYWNVRRSLICLSSNRFKVFGIYRKRKIPRLVGLALKAGPKVLLLQKEVFKFYRGGVGSTLNWKRKLWEQSSLSWSCFNSCWQSHLMNKQLWAVGNIGMGIYILITWGLCIRFPIFIPFYCAEDARWDLEVSSQIHGRREECCNFFNQTSDTESGQQ